MRKADLFVESLQRAEKQHSPEPLLHLFGEESELTRLNSDHPYTGAEGARDFWNEYFSLFHDVQSRFTNVLEAGGTAILEWEADGHFHGGAPVSYRGVSIVEFAGDRVRSFRTYYDSAPFAQATHA